MLGRIKKTPAARKNYSDCSGCSLCLLVCPVWRQSRDVSLTPHGHAKAMQHGVSAADAAASVENCTLCMACEPVCPENIDITGMILDLRRQQAAPAWLHSLQASMNNRAARPIRSPLSSSMLLPDQALHAHPDTLARIARLLGNNGTISISDNSGSDISLALEAGVAIPEQHLERFLKPLRRLKKIIVADGLLLRHLKQWLPNANIISLGEALSGHADVRRGLRATDLYVIEPRAYHSDYQRLVKHYDRLRAAHGCAFNLDLQRIAIPVTARNLPQRLGLTMPNDEGQTRWVLHGRNINRIVVESLEERAALEKAGGFPVVHLADLADDGVRV
ncbi:MAG: 4Fe-4S dicluster domain-containing protein [Gallionella sp.]|nr:4Fe-4S dicluster domain-containing protein [Gallionella sp.]